ncbi:ABC transporter permease subunit [Plantactinospora veratri]
MSQVATTPAQPRAAASPYRATFADGVRSEWTKVRSLRSVAYTLLVTVVLGVGIGSLLAFAGARGYASMPAAEQAAFDPTSRSLAGYILAQLALGFLGAFVITSEFATGMIRTSLSVVPRRGRLLTAKVVVFAAVALVVGELVGFGSFFAGQAILRGQGAPHSSLGDPGVLRAIAGSGLYLTAVGLLGVALGVLVRASTGAIGIVVVVTFLVPAFTPALPESWARFVGKYWPSMAGREIMAVQHDPHLLPPWAGFGLMCAAVAAVLAVAFIIFGRRDA